MPLGANKAAIMGVAGVSTADVVLIQSQTASNSASITFSSGITSTYGEYIFKFYNINPASDTGLTFQASTDSGSNYDTTVTTTHWWARLSEADTEGAIGYDSESDTAQGTGYVLLAQGMGNGGDESLAGELHLYNPAGTTYVKHWHFRGTHNHSADYNYHWHTAGYFNTTSAIDAVSFKGQSGNLDGTIKMWGVK